MKRRETPHGKMPRHTPKSTAVQPRLQIHSRQATYVWQECPGP